ncbi:MAG: glycine cleavage system aminomethyltransferase GcvT [Nitrospirae bacterium]|nr:glycine cleavage system aminomethyltransferase GcvT [Candidatus Troglogloeales bacterium]MBI3598906.1 glycine cleavage system aminomethyltransferase GcvT [Candidatus Troglogloeales bacterium]
MNEIAIKKTALYDLHLKLGAKFVSFAGWEMPIHYAGSGILKEHQTVRTDVGLFDISHMGRFELSGKGCEAMLSRIVPTPTQKMKRGDAQYSMLLNEEGTVLDDIYIYKKGKDKFFLIVNASNREKDFLWLQGHLENPAILQDVTLETALLALQGPKSWNLMERVLPFDKEEIALRTFVETEIIPARGNGVLVARTGYTGERGYEIVAPLPNVTKVWNALLAAGGELKILPIGLGARDTLRLEKGYPLYGHEINENTTPIEAGLDKFIDFTKEFIGKAPLILQQAKGVTKKLICFQLLVGGVPREGYSIYSGEKEVGKVTSGNFSPSLKKGIGMGFVAPRYADIGSEIFVSIHDRGAAAVIVKPPFYRKGK